jgi:hypothetical protein
MRDRCTGSHELQKNFVACVRRRTGGWIGKAFYAGMGLNDDGRGVLYFLRCLAFSKSFRFKL